MTVSFDLFVWVVGGLAVTFLTMFWFVTGLMLKLRNDFSDYKTLAGEKFASKGYLQDVEARLSKELGHLAVSIDKFDGTIQALTLALGRIEGRIGGQSQCAAIQHGHGAGE